LLGADRQADTLGDRLRLVLCGVDQQQGKLLTANAGGRVILREWLSSTEAANWITLSPATWP
jgi:hypothetical protein